MSRFGRDRNRIEGDRTQALSHPVRRRILALFTKDRDRSLAVDVLLADLVAEDSGQFGKFNEGQIAYHRARLQDAELLPG